MPQQRQNKDLYKFPTERTKGIVATIIFHVIIVVVLIISGFKTPLPLPEEEGIIVNFGYDQTGSGILEPAVSSSSQQSSSPEQEGATDEAVAEIIEEVVSNNESITEPEQENLTQDFEEAPVVEKKVDKPDQEVERKRQEEIEAERIRQQKLEEERIKKEAEEAERIRQEQAERQRIEDSIRLAQEQERRRQDIINRTRTALSNAEGTGTGENQGIAGGEGNQGVETGAEGVKKYGEGGGTGNEGISYDLTGRQALSLPKPKYDSQSEGIVVVEVTVDRNGNVTQAVPGVKGSTTLEDYFLRVAREAAMATKFNRKPDATVIQKGTITYHFILR